MKADEMNTPIHEHLLQATDKSHLTEDKVSKNQDLQANCITVKMKDGQCQSYRVPENENENENEKVETKLDIVTKIEMVEMKLDIADLWAAIYGMQDAEKINPELEQLKADVQTLKDENSFLKDVLQSNESMWTKPKHTCRIKRPHN